MAPRILQRKAKMVCTLGPSTDQPMLIEKLILAGMNVARINFSHGDHTFHGRLIEMVRSVSRKLGIPVSILQDLQGPKIRVGSFPGGPVCLKPGATFVLTTRQVEGSCSIASVSYPKFHEDVKTGDLVLLDDGNLSLKVAEVHGQDVTCKVVYGGELKNHKGLNLPGNVLSVDCLTEKDLIDLEFGLKHGVDYVALSFVQKASDITALRAKISEFGANVPIVAKIEKPQAVNQIEEIIGLTDVIMIARGDLGVEMATEEVPFQQKRIIGLCNQAGVPVITATQMLESMITHPRPTRAEATDVANAILDGSDAVMLSGETAAGRFPIESAQTMNRIIQVIEKKAMDNAHRKRREAGSDFEPSIAISYAACHAAEMVGASALICLTQSGKTARNLSRYRPETPILAMTNTEETFNRIALLWGVTAHRITPFDGDFEACIRRLKVSLVEEDTFAKDDRLVFLAGLPFSDINDTNTLRIETT